LSVQGHVAALDAFAGQRFERREVLRQPHGADDFGQFVRGGNAEDAQGKSRAGMDLQRAAHGADGQDVARALNAESQTTKHHVSTNGNNHGARGGTLLARLPPAESGAVTVIQRANSDLRLNPHLHTAFDDGVYGPDRDGKGQMFHPPPASTAQRARDCGWRSSGRRRLAQLTAVFPMPPWGRLGLVVQTGTSARGPGAHARPARPSRRPRECDRPVRQGFSDRPYPLRIADAPIPLLASSA
jgi:hypothetical protein